MHDSDKKKYLDFSGLEYIVDSFTYSPFVDYSCSNDAKVGIYADDYLTKYNSGWFEDKTNLGIDVNRRPITSTLYELYDLQKDIYDAKISFRNAIVGKDSLTLDSGETVEKNAKNSIFVFCDHLFKLFSKLSNVRMCHEIYGMKAPHA